VVSLLSQATKMHLLKRYGGELGILVDPDDVEELADVLIKVLKKKFLMNY